MPFVLPSRIIRHTIAGTGTATGIGVRSTVIEGLLFTFDSTSAVGFTTGRIYSSSTSSSVQSSSIQFRQRFLFRRTFSTTPPLLLKMSSQQEFKLKDAPSLSSLSNGQKLEVEVEGVENAKVLLVQLDGKTHAIGPKCTHFGAPLKNGVLSSSGRLVCPWHGACFKVTTGDVEDAPAPDGLATFELVEKAEGVFVRGDEAAVKSGRRSIPIACKAVGGERVVIVGGGSGTFGAVQALRENNFTGAITVISKEGNYPIDRTKLSKALIPDASKLELRSKEWYEGAGVEYTFDEVTSIDFPKKEVSTKSGRSYQYTKLILATGGTPRKLPLPGFKDLGNVFVLRTVEDVQGILKAVGDKGKNIVIVGSSFIGMEVGNALAKDNNVSIVGMESAPLERVMGAEVGAIFQRLLEKNGVKFYMGASVDKATPSSTLPSDVGAVLLKDGPKLEADLVILGVGVAPETSYLRDNPAVTLERDGSLQTDTTFAVKNLPDVYAIGDIASYPYHGPGGNGSYTRIEHWNVAQNSGRSVAHTIIDKNPPQPFFIPIFWSALGNQLRYCGNTVNGFDELVLKGQPEENKFSAFYCKGEVVVAVATMMMDPVMSKSAELMLEGKMPSKKEIKDGGVDVVLEIPFF